MSILYSEAIKYRSSGDFEKSNEILDLLNTNSLKAKLLKMENNLFLGNVENFYKAYKEIGSNPDIEIYQNYEVFFEIMNKIGFKEKLPEIEPDKANKTYKKSEIIDFFSNEKKLYSEFEIFQMINSEDKEIKAKGYFFRGENFQLNNDRVNASYNYHLAVENNPNNALYWGILADNYYFMGEHVFKVLRYINKAILIEPENPFWIKTKTLALTKASIYLSFRFIFAAKNNLIKIKKDIKNDDYLQKIYDELKETIDIIYKNLL